MTETVIRVENLSKRYRIGMAEEMHDTFIGAMTSIISNPLKNLRNLRRLSSFSDEQQNEKDVLWALKNVSFEVKRGEVLGVIGRNGAGKSTLLKILTRITYPTEGRIELNGRVASLLEVGTGFHPELTGRENIYLNGTILGMSKNEIDRKLDEIIDFSGVEKFIDTPVKRYSSGMRVRLAFSVAAHLEPEILLIDEVLAVGDFEFQRKCLDKMGEVAEGGRTVLFVSHNMGAVQQLCSRVIHIANGQLIDDGDTEKVVRNYLTTFTTDAKGKIEWSYDLAPGDDDCKLKSVAIIGQTFNPNGVYESKEDLLVEMGFILNKVIEPLCVGFDILTSNGIVILRSFQTDLSEDKWLIPQLGLNLWRCKLKGGILNAGSYHLSPRIGIYNQYWNVYTDSVLKFEIVLNHSKSPLWTVYTNNRPGLIAPILEWQYTKGK